MSEPSGLRDLSKMEFYKNAKRIRKNIDLWLIREFGIKKNPRSIKQVAKDISEEDLKVINEIYAKYGVNPNRAYNAEYPDWYMDDEKKLIKKYCNMLTFYIVQANKLHPNYDFEWEQRRQAQNDAIGVVQNLYVEIDHIKEMFDVSLKFTTDLMDALDREEDLIKGWRQSDNKKKTQIVKLEKGFSFLQIRYNLTESGKIIKRPVRKGFVRERRKLKKLAGLVNQNKMTISQIKDQYKSWRGNIIRYNCYNSVKNLDALYKSIIGDLHGRKQNGKTDGA